MDNMITIIIKISNNIIDNSIIVSIYGDKHAVYDVESVQQLSCIKDPNITKHIEE